MKLQTVDRQILKIALPAIISNITVPLLGLVDTGIAGHLGDAAYIGAIALGGVIFSVIYWPFCFLRMGTSGLTAQDLGTDRHREVSLTLYRACLLGAGIGLALIAMQWCIYEVAQRLMDIEPQMVAHARTYFYICIWGALPTLLLYALNGWFVGMQNSRITMLVAIVQNTANIPLSLLLVFGCGMKIAGVALGTVLAQYIGLMVALLMLRHTFRRYLVRVNLREVVQRQALVRFLSVNSDILLRMLCLMAVTVWFTVAGSRQGELVLAANAILFQLFYLFSFFFDGFANAAEAICGKCKGAHDAEGFVLAVKRVFACGLILVVAFTAVYVLAEDMILETLTDDPRVVCTAQNYFCWLLLVPACGIMAFVWDGVFIGATATRSLLLSMVTGTVCFFSGYFLLFPSYGNDGLWLSFLLYLLGRGIPQCFVFPKVIGKV